MVKKLVFGDVSWCCCAVVQTHHKPVLRVIEPSWESFFRKEVESVFCLNVYHHSAGKGIFIAVALFFPTKKLVCFSVLIDWTPAHVWVRTISSFSIIPHLLGQNHFQLSTWKGHIFTSEYIWQTEGFLLITNLRNYYQYNVTLQLLNSTVSIYSGLGSAYVPSASLRHRMIGQKKRKSYQEIGNR